MQANVDELNYILLSLKIKARCISYYTSDHYSFYDVELQGNGKIKDLQKFSEEIGLRLKLTNSLHIKLLHEKALIRLEYFSKRSSVLNYYFMSANQSLPLEGELNCCIGESYDGKKIWMDLATNPHMLVAGTTGSGKSVLLHNIIANLLIHNNIDLFLIDPKKIEFNLYKDLNNCTVIENYDDSVVLLNSLLELMNYRYNIMKLGFNTIKPIVLIIDEFSDLIYSDKSSQVYDKLCLLAQKCRAAKIFIILAAQRPSADVINGNIKANFPARIACKVNSHFDSKIILESSGAENLLGNGDAFIKSDVFSKERFQIAFASAKDTLSYLNHNK